MRRIVFKENDRVGSWMQEHGGGYYRVGSQCIGLEENGTLIAGVMYDWHNGASIYMHVAAVGRHWLSQEFLRICFDYPFNQLKCNVVIGIVAEDNTRAQRFDEHLGFSIEHRIKNADPSGDMIIYTMRKENCRWINGKT